MEKSVVFRDFEERDIEFVYKCKNDEDLNRLIVGPFHKFSYEEAVNWVHGCMGEHENYKFWAACTNDKDKKIIGWISLSNIDKVYQSACLHGIVIGDRDYRDGYAWIEMSLFMIEYAFEQLNLNRVYGMSLVEHKMSSSMNKLLFMQKEGVLRQAVYKDGQFHDLDYVAILKDEYFSHKKAGDYKLLSIIRSLKQLHKQTK